MSGEGVQLFSSRFSDQNEKGRGDPCPLFASSASARSERVSDPPERGPEGGPCDAASPRFSRIALRTHPLTVAVGLENPVLDRSSIGVEVNAFAHADEERAYPVIGVLHVAAFVRSHAGNPFLPARMLRQGLPALLTAAQIKQVGTQSCQNRSNRRPGGGVVGCRVRFADGGGKSGPQDRPCRLDQLGAC